MNTNEQTTLHDLLCIDCVWQPCSLYWVIKELETRYVIWAPVLITQQECCNTLRILSNSWHFILSCEKHGPPLRQTNKHETKFLPYQVSVIILIFDSPSRTTVRPSKFNKKRCCWLCCCGPQRGLQERRQQQVKADGQHSILYILESLNFQAAS